LRLAVGYRGQITGWERGSAGLEPADASWWHVEESLLEEALTWVVVQPDHG
jgi:hypothetical protein